MTEQDRIRRIDLVFRVVILALAALWLVIPHASTPEPQRPKLTLGGAQR
jgi:hypothetical protein